MERHVYRPLPGLDFRVLNREQEDVREGEVGELHVRGRTVSPGYVGDDGRISVDRGGTKDTNE